MAETTDQHATQSTGYTHLDTLIGGGLRQSDVVVIAGRPNTGKSTLARNIAENIGHEGKTVGVFSLSEPAQRWGRKTTSMKQRSTDVLSNVLIDDTSGLTFIEMCERARRLKINAQRGLCAPVGLLIVDYVELLELDDSRDACNEVDNAPRDLKALATELDIPILALAQLKRAVEQRDNKHPVLEDIRADTPIASCDVVAFLYRDDLYDDDSAAKGITEISIAKQVNGPLGKTLMEFRGLDERFTDHSIN